MDVEFSSCEPFGIDDGQLDDKTPQECFVLGYELADIARLAELESDRIDRPVHADNRERIEAFLTERNRRFQLTWAGDDRSETWMHLSIAPRED